YECLTGRRPFEADAMGPLMTAICNGDAVPIVDLAPHVPAIISAVIERCLRVSLEQRYADAAVLRDAWAAGRTTSHSWAAETWEQGEAVTRPLWTATRVPLPSYAGAATTSAGPTLWSAPALKLAVVEAAIPPTRARPIVSDAIPATADRRLA